MNGKVLPTKVMKPTQAVKVLYFKEVFQALGPFLGGCVRAGRLDAQAAFPNSCWVARELGNLICY